MGFKMIYWTPKGGSYFLYGSILEKCGKFWKNGHFSCMTEEIKMNIYAYLTFFTVISVLRNLCSWKLKS